MEWELVAKLKFWFGKEYAELIFFQGGDFRFAFRDDEVLVWKKVK